MAAISEFTILVPSHFCSLEDSVPDLQMSCSLFKDQRVPVASFTKEVNWWLAKRPV